MAEFAALPLFTDAITADCGHLSDEEFGRYVRILILMWRTPGCRIPKDPEWISKRLRIDPARFDAAALPLLNEFCKCDGNWWVQKRLQKEFSYVKNKSAKQSVRAKSRWNKEKQPSPGNAAPVSSRHPSGNAPTPTPTPTVKKDTNVSLAVLPTWMPLEEWLAYKTKRGKTFTSDVQRRCIGQLKKWRDEGMEPAEVINQTLMNGWKGLFPLKGSKNGKTTGHAALSKLTTAARRASDEKRMGQREPDDMAETAKGSEPRRTGLLADYTG